MEWQPSAVVALAFSPITESLAVARDNADIELWTITSGPSHCFLRIPGRKDLSIKALAWSVHEEEEEDAASSDDDEESDSSAEKGKEQGAKRQRVQPAPTQRTRKERLFSAGIAY